MTRKIIAGVAGCVLLASIALFAAEKAQGKKPAAKPKQQTTAVEKQSKQTGLLDQLIAAYKADDKKAMGDIIKKMETRRDKMQKLAKLNKWHQQVHRRWALASVGGGRGQQMAGPRWGSSWQPRGGQFCQKPCCWQGAGAMGGWEPQTGGRGQMPGWGQGPRRFAPQTSNMPRGDERQMRVPPADWGW